MDHAITPTPLDREEYIEQEHFFAVLRERLADNVPTQVALGQIRDEILAVTKLPMAIDFMRTEVMHGGRIHPAMAKIAHYFTPFQTFVIAAAESDTSKFDMAIALLILERMAGFLAREPSRAGLFVYQFECISRNRLGYDAGLTATANDPYFDDAWRTWIGRVSGQLGVADFADLIYYRSEDYVFARQRAEHNPTWRPDFPILFSRSAGRIANANRGKDPLYLFAALQRQLDYPRVPKPKPPADDKLPPAQEARLARLEKRLQLLEAEQRSAGIDLNEFIKRDPGAAGFDSPSNLGGSDFD